MNAQILNFLLLLNEYTILSGSHFIFVFTRFTTNNESKYSLGWTFVMAVASVIAINIVMTIVKSLVEIARWCKQRRLKKLYQKVAE